MLAATGVGAGRDDDPRLGHRVVGTPERLLHRSRHRTCNEQHVGVPRAGREEQAEPLHVVVRVQQRRDLLLDRAVGSRVDVADVQGAAERPRPAARASTSASATAAAHDKPLALRTASS